MTPGGKIAVTFCESAGCEVRGKHDDCRLAMAVDGAITAAVAEERKAILSIIAGGDRPWQELAKIIRARKA